MCESCARRCAAYFAAESHVRPYAPTTTATTATSADNHKRAAMGPSFPAVDVLRFAGFCRHSRCRDDTAPASVTLYLFVCFLGPFDDWRGGGRNRLQVRSVRGCVCCTRPGRAVRSRLVPATPSGGVLRGCRVEKREVPKLWLKRPTDLYISRGQSVHAIRRRLLDM